jgi:hypothetical protein
MVKVIKTSGDLNRAICELVAYCWRREENDYKKHPRPDHIFRTITALDNWSGIKLISRNR